MNNSYQVENWLSFSEEALVELIKSSCRLCMTQSASRINLMTKERDGQRLMDMANMLTGLPINEHDTRSLFVCLNCAGKLVNFYEFREQCQKIEKKIDTIDTALRLKQMKNQPHNGSILLDVDEDMEIIYGCKVCNLSFRNNNEYLEHKKQHSAQNGDSFNMSGRGRFSQNEGIGSPIKQEIAATSTNLYECRSCPRTFRTYMAR